MHCRFDPFNICNSDTESGTSTYNLLFLLTLAIGTYAIAKFGESNNRLNYESRPARIIAGLLLLMINAWHTRNGDVEISDAKKKLIVAGPHKTGWDAFVVASKMKGTPPQFLATDAFNPVPGVAPFMKMFKTIPVKSKPTKGDNGRTANAGSLDLANNVLSKDGCVALFPQGNFSRIDQPPPIIYTGAAKLALANKIPIHVIRLDGFWCLQNPLIPIFIRNNAFYRAFFSILHMNNVRVTLCPMIDFHLKLENKNLTDQEKIEEICAELYAYYRHTEELDREQISAIKTEISAKTHLLIWNKVKEGKPKKEAPLKKNKIL